MAKYPNYGILDALEKMLHGTSTRQALREPLFGRVKNLYPMTRSEYARKLYDLRKGGHISYDSDRKGIKLTDKGKRRLDFDRLAKLQWKSKERDQYYWLIMFDIPEVRLVVRDILRQKLREFACFQIQKSVYVTPYKCEQVMTELIKLLHIQKHVHVMKIADLGHDLPEISRRFKF
mgnify:CR=1 FL=1